jgi:hypothetical protein
MKVRETFKYNGGSIIIMRTEERDELLIRIDERVKTVFNRMEKFETLFTNHLHHHQMWENDIKTSLQRWLAVVVTAAGGAGAIGMM